MRRLLKFCTWFAGIAGLAILAIIGYVQWRFVGRIVTADRASAPIAIVLGASVTSNQRPSDALRDRLDTAIDLWRRGSVKQILITGDDGSNQVDEISVMQAYLQSQNVSSSAILVDAHGYRTYESCKRAKTIFHVAQAVIVTQRFHLGRALYLCERFGIASQGVAADRQTYKRIFYFTVRDLLASFKAWWDINL